MIKKNKLDNKIIPCIIGLGYVGLPLLVNLSKKFKIIGFDINKKRVNTLKNGIDLNNEFSKNEIPLKKNCLLTFDPKDLSKSNFYIITVPTPIQSNYKPDLSYVTNACKMISKFMKNGDIIFLESTVYPGVTNDICKNILSKTKKSFYIGYSPERVNPGDKNHTISKINKIVSIETTNRKIINKVKKVYSHVCKKIFFSRNIREAETAKVIENIQRDLNIGLFNEIYKVCEKLNINFNEVIRLASSKWNFIKYNKGLVGGHCLPVDPYYISYLAKKKNVNMSIVLAGRKVNNGMKNYFLNKIKKNLNKLNLKNKKICICGVTYKPNVSDMRNSLAVEISKKISESYSNCYTFDPLLQMNDIKKLGLRPINNLHNSDILIILTRHNKVINLLSKCKNKIILDYFK